MEGEGWPLADPITHSCQNCQAPFTHTHTHTHTHTQHVNITYTHPTWTDHMHIHHTTAHVCRHNGQYKYAYNALIPYTHYTHMLHMNIPSTHAPHNTHMCVHTTDRTHMRTQTIYTVYTQYIHTHTCSRPLGTSLKNQNCWSVVCTIQEYCSAVSKLCILSGSRTLPWKVVLEGVWPVCPQHGIRGTPQPASWSRA